LTVPLSVAELSVTFVADPVETFGIFVLVDLYVTVMVSTAVLPPLSLAVTVIILSPFDRLMLEIVQLVVPLAVPLPPLLLVHVTSFIPLVLSDALPPRLIVLLVAVYVASDVGLVIFIVGEVVSRVISSLAAFDTFPEESLNHTYTVLLPSLPLKVYETLPE
jgi:hypothetical protein